MPKTLNINRRRFFGAAAMSIAAAQLGTFTSATRKPQTADLGTQPGAHTSFATLKQIPLKGATTGRIGGSELT